MSHMVTSQSPTSAASILTQLINDEAVAVPMCTPVYVDAPGGFKMALGDGSAKSKLVGVVIDQSIPATKQGAVLRVGVVTATTAQWDAVCGTSGGLLYGTLYYLSTTVPGALTTSSASNVPVIFGLGPTVGAIVTGGGSGGGVTNSAGNNVVMKSDGTNAVASHIADNGSTVSISSGTFTISTDGDPETFSTHFHAGTAGGNIWIGGGGTLVTGTGAQGSSNTSLGQVALSQVTTGAYNTAIGQDAAAVLSTGVDNTAIGQAAMLSLLSGISNTAVGVQALELCVSANNNTAVGLNSLQQTLGANNTAIGCESCSQGTTAFNNVVSVGFEAGKPNTGSNNTFLGLRAGTTNTSGDLNTFVGKDTGTGVTTGRANTMIGASVIGLAAGLSNTVIIADGDGNIRMQVDSSGNAKLSGSVQLNTTGPKWSSGAGSPAGVVTGSPGDLYTNTTGSAGTTLYVKESGSATTAGWVAK